MSEVKTALETAEGLAKAIMETRQHRLQAECEKPPWKPRRHYASGLNGCARNMVYAIQNWQEKERFTPEAIASMQDGNHEERLLIQELLADGFEVVETQVQLDDDRYWVTGKIDGKIIWEGKRIPFDVKRIKQWAFEKLNSVEDLRADPWQMKNLRQMTLYLYLHSIEAGMFILSNGLGDRKTIVVPMDFALAEQILKDLDTANASLKSETGDLPDRIPYQSRVCGFCSFRRICLPDMDFGQGAVLGGEELTEAVKRYEEIKPVVSEAERLKKDIRKATENKPITIVGEFVVEGEWKERNMKAQPERVDKFWQVDIQKLNGSDNR